MEDTSTSSVQDKEKSKEELNDDFKRLLEQQDFKIPKAGELIRGNVISASKSEVKLDINGYLTGVVRGPELYEEDEEYANLKPGDEVEATIIDEENENGELELSFRYAGQEKAWSGLRDAYENRKIIKVKVVDANKGGLMVNYRQIPGFLPVSQLAPENYPRVNGGDKGKILEKLKSFVGKEFEVKPITIETKEDKIIFSEKEAWNETQKNVISKYKVGTVVEGNITAITDFGVFVSFGENLEGLVHISELAWQRIDNPNDLFKVGDKIKAEIISVENSKIFLSSKKLIKDPWHDVDKKYKKGQVVEGSILKVNPFGLFIELDEDIHGLAHISQLDLAPKQKINEKFKINQKLKFEIVSIEPKDHRLGLAYLDKLNEGKVSDRPELEESRPEPEKKEKAKEEKKEIPKKGEKKETEKKKNVKKGKEAKPETEKTKKNLKNK